MSQRHHQTETVPPPKMDLRAHAHNERHRIHSELSSVANQVSSGLDADDLHEPGRAWVPLHHHDATRGKERAMKRSPRHWKMKMWKRRTTMRQAKAASMRMVAEQA